MSVVFIKKIGVKTIFGQALKNVNVSQKAFRVLFIFLQTFKTYAGYKDTAF